MSSGSYIITFTFPTNLIHTSHLTLSTWQRLIHFLPSDFLDTFWLHLPDASPDGPATGSVDDFSTNDDDTSTLDLSE